MHVRRTALAALALALAAPPASHAAGYTATDLGTLGGFVSAATAINDHGHVIGQSTTPSFATHSFFWTPGGGMVDIGTLGGQNTQALAVSDTDRVVGWSDTSAGVRHAFSWTEAGGMVDLGTLGGPRSRAAAVNRDGRVAGWSETEDGQTHAFTWTAGGGMIDLGTGIAMDVNDAGQVVGSADATAFVWTEAGGKVSLGTLGGSFSIGVAINERGQVTGTSQTVPGTSRPFFWSASTGMIDLGTLGGSFASPVSINASGRVAGWGAAPDGQSHGFLWSAGTGMVDLGSSGGNFMAQGMNDSGHIVGTTFATFPSFESRITLWTPEDGFVSLGAYGGPPTTVSVNASGQVAANANLGAGPHAVVWTPTGTPPAITSPAEAVFTIGRAGSFTITTSGDPTAGIAVDGDLPAGLAVRDNGDGTATIEGVPAPGTGGMHPLAVTASNGVAPDADQSLTIRIAYVFHGFFAPVQSASGLHDANAGQSIPVKFDLDGNQGVDVMAADSSRSRVLDCITRVPLGAAEPAVATESLSYDPTENAPSGLYKLVWKTERGWTGTCRRFELGLADGSVHSFDVRFR